MCFTFLSFLGWALNQCNLFLENDRRSWTLCISGPDRHRAEDPAVFKKGKQDCFQGLEELYWTCRSFGLKSCQNVEMFGSCCFCFFLIDVADLFSDLQAKAILPQEPKSSKAENRILGMSISTQAPKLYNLSRYMILYNLSIWFIMCIYIYIHTTWWFQPSGKYEFVSWDDELPNWMEKCSKPPTSISG